MELVATKIVAKLFVAVNGPLVLCLILNDQVTVPVFKDNIVLNGEEKLDNEPATNVCPEVPVAFGLASFKYGSVVVAIELSIT
ncbi:MAG: hypothetical protein ACOYNC_06165 [Bacteroidales bacterium]